MSEIFTVEFLIGAGVLLAIVGIPFLFVSEMKRATAQVGLRGVLVLLALVVLHFAGSWVIFETLCVAGARAGKGPFPDSFHARVISAFLAMAIIFSVAAVIIYPGTKKTEVGKGDKK